MIRDLLMSGYPTEYPMAEAGQGQDVPWRAAHFDPVGPRLGPNGRSGFVAEAMAAAAARRLRWR